jgi:hypothetical protein
MRECINQALGAIIPGRTEYEYLFFSTPQPNFGASQLL